jgi:hypothetical protein
MQKSIIFLIISLIAFSGCLNKRGISGTYYNDCREYYDARGYHHEKCDENLIEFADVKEGTVKAYESAKKAVLHEEYVEPEHKVVW